MSPTVLSRSSWLSIRAAGQAQRESIYAKVHPGTLRDAIFYSLSADRFHGLPRSNSDKRSAVEIALKDQEWQQMSDRSIADHCGVSPPFVGKIRAKLIESGTVNVSSERTDRKGRRINTSNISTKPKESAAEAEELPSAQFDQNEAPQPPAAERSLLQMDIAIANLCERHGAKQVALWALDECTSAELAELEKEIPLIRWERGE